MLFNFYGRPDRSCGADSFERRIVPLRRQQTHPSVFLKTTQNWFTPTSAFFFFSFFFNFWSFLLLYAIIIDRRSSLMARVSCRPDLDILAHFLVC
jgi:hypothetical protein